MDLKSRIKEVNGRLHEESKHSAILMTLDTKISFQQAKLIDKYNKWKKYDF